MMLDIRLPIGYLFSLLGTLLIGYGLFADASIQESAMLNVNAWWGAGLLTFGLGMALAAWRAKRKSAHDQP